MSSDEQAPPPATQPDKRAAKSLEEQSPEELRGSLRVLQARQELQQEELRLSRLALQEKERALRLIANHSGGHVSRLDRDLRYLFVNDQCEALFGKSAAMLLGRTMRDSLDANLVNYIEPYAQRARWRGGLV